VASGGSLTARLGSTSTDVVLIGGGGGKLTVGTVDPVYNIEGKKFATFFAGMTGIKEETAGVIEVKQKPEGKDYYQAEIDFNNLKEGSDLWIFSKVTNLKKNIDKLTVLLTPASRAKVWYQVDPQNFKLYFFTEKPTTISYRLTAPRFDWEKWKNVVEDPEIQGLSVTDEGEVISSNTIYQYSEENNEEGILEKIISLVQSTLEKLGLIIKDGIAQIKEIITERLSSETIVTNQLCIGQTCIDEAKLKELLERNGSCQTSFSTFISSTPTPSPTPTPTSIPSPSPTSLETQLEQDTFKTNSNNSSESEERLSTDYQSAQEGSLNL
jgi:hypothetical protein